MPADAPAAEDARPAGGGWSFARVIRLLYDEERTGVLEVSGNGGSWDIHLRAGQVVDAVRREGGTWMLGDLLVATGAIRAERLERAMRVARRKGEPVESVLLARRLVSDGVLRRLRGVEIRETLLPLFGSASLTCVFREIPPAPSVTAPPLPLSWVLREAERRAAQQSELDAQVPATSAVYARVPGTAAAVLGGGAASSEPSDEGGAEPAAGGAERLVYYCCDGRRTVAEVALASALGEHETRRALAGLLEQGYVRLVAEQPPAQRSERTVLPLLSQLALYGPMAGAVALLALGPGSSGLGARLSPVDPAAAAVLAASQQARLRHALDVYHAERGTFPPSLGELVSAGLAEPSDLGAALWGTRLAYEVEDDGTVRILRTTEPRFGE